MSSEENHEVSSANKGIFEIKTYDSPTKGDVEFGIDDESRRESLEFDESIQENEGVTIDGIVRRFNGLSSIDERSIFGETRRRFSRGQSSSKLLKEEVDSFSFHEARRHQRILRNQACCTLTVEILLNLLAIVVTGYIFMAVIEDTEKVPRFAQAQIVVCISALFFSVVFVVLGFLFARFTNVRLFFVIVNMIIPTSVMAFGIGSSLQWYWGERAC